MAGNYTLIATQSSIQVISPTVIQDVVVITIQTQPHGVIADIWVTKDEWDQGATSVTLTGFAANIEKIMDSPQVVGATTGSVLDANGLLQSEISFVVGYTPPGSPYPPATVDVDISANSLRPEDVMGTEPGVTAALAAINDAYNQLVAVAAGTSVKSPSTGGQPPPPPQPPPGQTPPPPPPPSGPPPPTGTGTGPPPTPLPPTTSG